MSATGIDASDAAGPSRTAGTHSARRAGARAEAGDLALWAAAVLFGSAATILIVAADVGLGGRLAGEPPFTVGWEPRIGAAAVLAPAVAGITLAIARWCARIGWSALLVLSFVGSLCWSLTLAAAAGPGITDGLRAQPEYLTVATLVGDDPRAFLEGYPAQGHSGGGYPAEGYSDEGGPGGHPEGNAYPAAVSAHPPGPVLLVWGLGRLGLDDPVLLGVLLTTLTALTIPIVTVAVRSLCHETAARRAVPVLVLAPWAIWTAASPPAVTTTVAAAAVTVGVVGCAPGRRLRWCWAVASGLLLGVTALFGYAAVWLGVAIAAAYFVRRRPLMNVGTGVGALLPLWLFTAWGFAWPDGLAAARPPTGPATAVAWLVLDAAIIALLGGPVLVRALRRVRLTPGWPFLVGSGAVALFGLGAGLAWGGVEESWLPLMPWLLVAALAPRPRPAGPGDTVRAGELPLGLVGMGAFAAVVLRLCLAGPGP